MKVCKECLGKWDPYFDSGSMMCSHCEQSSNQKEIKISEYILHEFKKRSDKLYFSLPDQGEEFRPNGGHCVDPMSYFSDKIQDILEDILSSVDIDICEETTTTTKPKVAEVLGYSRPGWGA